MVHHEHYELPLGTRGVRVGNIGMVGRAATGTAEEVDKIAIEPHGTFVIGADVERERLA